MKATAVIVSYNPDIEQLKQLCFNLSCVSTVVIVDNSCDNLLISSALKAVVIYNRSNLGIAAAQNIGISYARAIDSTHVLFFDQDSILSLTDIRLLLNQAHTKNLEVIAPVCIDAISSKEYPSYRFGVFGFPSKVFSGLEQNLIATDLVIASGMVFSISVFDTVGMMDEALFIDLVDFEWCARARSKGVRIYIVPGARLMHHIGTGRGTRLGSAVFTHNPLRHYYQARNSVYLLRLKHVPLMYRIYNFAVLLLRLLLQFPRNSWQLNYIKMGLIGLWDGVKGKMGVYKT